MRYIIDYNYIQYLGGLYVSDGKGELVILLPFP